MHRLRTCKNEMEVKGRFTLRNYPMGQTHHTLLGKEEVLKKKKKKKRGSAGLWPLEQSQYL